MKLSTSNWRTLLEVFLGTGFLLTGATIYFDWRGAEREDARYSFELTDAVLKLAERSCVANNPDKTKDNLQLLTLIGGISLSEAICFSFDSTSVDFTSFARPSAGNIILHFGTERRHPIL